MGALPRARMIAVSGLVLAGGQGSRMGGVDKGLQPFRGKPMVAHVLERLEPQVDEVESIRLNDDLRITEETLFGLMNAVRVHESIYKQAGAVHGCALAKGAEILTFVEDVGRHNAVDAIAGWMWLEDVDGRDKIFYTTGRLTSEMVIKAAQMQIPVLVSRSGLTKMGHEVASQVGITMIGRAVNKHYLLFTGAHRLVKSPPPQPSPKGEGAAHV